MDKLQLMLEADRRGLLPPDQKALLDEAVKRGIAGGVEAPPKPMGEQMNSIPRQIGLTARAGLESVGDTVGMLAEPLRLPLSAGLRATGLRDTPIPTARQMVDSAADAVGLPKPETPTERIANDAVRVMGGSGLTMGAAKAAGAIGQAAPTVRDLIRQFISNPGTQIAGAAGAGAAGGYTRETGGNEASQVLASVAGGVGAGAAANLGGRAVDAARNLRMPSQAATIELDATIQNILGPAVNWQELPQHVRNQLRGDVQQAMRQGPLTPDAVRRLADYRLADATPSRAGLTLDPVDITQQRNLSKFGANSKDRAVQGVARLENENARRLGTGVQELAGNVTNDRYLNSEQALAALRGIDDARGEAVSALYARARDSLGRAAPLDPATASQNAMTALAEAQAQGSLPAAARRMLNDVATGRTPFNVDTKEMMVRRLYEMQQGGSVNGSQRTAINIVRQALDDAPLLENHGLGPDALAAFRAARTAHSERMAAREVSPALQAAADGVQPDEFFKRFVIGNDAGNVRALNAMRDELGADSAPFRALRGQLVAYLKKAGNVNEQEGTFNSASFNNALDSIGRQKLGVFFSPEEVQRLQAIGRVARYEQVQPRGSAVNNSNTGGAVFNLLERLADSSAVTRIPIIGGAPQNMMMRVRANQAQDVPSAISMPAPRATDAPLLSPALAALMGGNAVAQDDKRKSGTK